MQKISAEPIPHHDGVCFAIPTNPLRAAARERADNDAARHRGYPPTAMTFAKLVLLLGGQAMPGYANYFHIAHLTLAEIQ